MKRYSFALIGALLAGICGCEGDRKTVRIGSKKFTESVILGELTRLLVRDSTTKPSKHLRELGGTRILWNAIRSGEIDIYPEYTGTIAKEIFSDRDVSSEAKLTEALAENGLRKSQNLGFYNNYALGMRKQRASELGITKISDLAKHPELVFGFSNEFLDRSDGWPSLRSVYQLPQSPKGLDHDLSYRALNEQSIDVTVLYTTDAEIRLYDLQALKDDREHFARYDALFLYRADLLDRVPAITTVLTKLTDLISTEEMIQMNVAAKRDKKPEARIASEFLFEKLGKRLSVEIRSRWLRIVHATGQHIYLVFFSLLTAILVGVPLGIYSAKHPNAGVFVLGTVSVIYTIPSLALLVLLMGLLEALSIRSLGDPPALVALFLYSLLPIVRNTHTGLLNISPALVDSAVALGLEPRARLRLVELPLASPTILAGIKTAAVVNVGFATLGALIGAGGYGQAILTGIRLDDIGLILEGAIPSAALALLVQGAFEIGERKLLPRGLRLQSRALS